jgi:hypothetical protein
MSDPFESSRRKIARAKKHLADLEGKIDSFFAQGDTYISIIEPHPDKSGYKIAKLRFTKNIPEECSELTNDILCNLRSALDNAVYALGILVGIPNPFELYFPFSRRESEFESNMKGRCKGLDKFFPYFRSCKPYDGGNDALWALNVARGASDHAFLIPAVTYGMMGGMEVTWTGSGSMPARPIFDPNTKEMELFTLGPETKLKAHYRIGCYIAFGEVGTLGGKNAGETLQLFVGLVETIIDQIEAEARRLGIVK